MGADILGIAIGLFFSGATSTLPPLSDTFVSTELVEVDFVSEPVDCWALTQRANRNSAIKTPIFFINAPKKQEMNKALGKYGLNALLTRTRVESESFNKAT